MVTEVILLLIVIIALFKLANAKPEGIPPGEWGLPIIGHRPPKSMFLRDYFDQMRDKFGDIFSLRMGSRLWVFLSDFNVIKSALGQPELTDRPDYFTFSLFECRQNLGITQANGAVWSNNRRFSLRHLRDLGFGKTSLGDSISDEVESLIKELDKKVGKPCELSFIFNAAVLNVIWRLISSNHYEINDPKINEFAALFADQFDAIQGPMAYLDTFPWLVNIIPKFVMRRWMNYSVFETAQENFFSYLMDVIKDHKKSLDPDNPRDYIDHYLLEIENQKNDKNSTFREDCMDLLVCVSDLFVNGSETTATSIRFTCLYLILYPEEQKKIQKQIDEHVPKHTLPSLEDREKLVYLDAVILEVQRKASLTPLGVPHSAIKDTTIEGYTIPKGTVIYPRVEYCHNNPKYWEKPDEFYPAHFINENGKLITKKEGYLPFSLGRRLCPGESMAKMNVFLFLAGMLQRYTISAPPGVDLKIEFDRNGLQFNGIRPFDVILTKR